MLILKKNFDHIPPTNVNWKPLPITPGSKLVSESTAASIVDRCLYKGRHSVIVGIQSRFQEFILFV